MVIVPCLLVSIQYRNKLAGLDKYQHATTISPSKQGNNQIKINSVTCREIVGIFNVKIRLNMSSLIGHCPAKMKVKDIKFL